ncbi:MAG: anthranilate synthase component I family protein, partial [Firmicutes bacterium]|nr:anthranilate synthase component I family protein [Bacillota bacterium]
ACNVREKETVRELFGDPWSVLEKILSLYRTPPVSFPLAHGGAIGYFGYEMGRNLVGLPAQRGTEAPGPPDSWFGFFSSLLILDHRAGETWLVATGHPDPASRVLARARLARLARLLAETCAEGEEEKEVNSGFLPARPAIHSLLDRASYTRAVARAKEYIAAGEIYQVNLSRRIVTEWSGDPLALYLRLREASPAPFGAFLRLDDETALLSASPELFLRIEGGRVETRPIKGTRPRGRTVAEDRRLARELLADEKERAELMMVVDLERNDLSRVCLPGTVEVPRLCGLESYAQVHHLVATVIGRRRPDMEAIDVLRATFPGGSITGVPKRRAMEIIEELEPVPRGPYTGSLGYMGFDGQAVFNILIRTGWIHAGRIHFQTGGAVTADSNPEREF